MARVLLIGLCVAAGQVIAEETASAPSIVSQVARSFRGTSDAVRVTDASPEVADLRETIGLQGYQAPGAQQGGYQQGGYQQGGYGYQQGGYQQGGYGDGKLSILLSFLIPVIVLVCVCCCIIHIVRCLCCSGDMAPIAGAGLGALAGYEMGKEMEGPGGYFGPPMY